MKNHLTVRELVEQLQKEDQDAFVAIENNGYPQKTTIMSTEGWLNGDFFMKDAPRIQDEYLMEDEIPAEEKDQFVKVVIINALISKDEIN